MTSVKDEQLVKQTIKGQQKAFDLLVERYFNLVYKIAWSHLGNTEKAEDLTQEVFLRVFLNLEKLKNPRRFAPWLSTITRNLARDWLRKGQRKSELISKIPLEQFSEIIPDPSNLTGRDKMEQQEAKATIQAAMLKLPPDQREAVLLSYSEGMSTKEIAVATGVKQSAIRYRLRLARETLQGLLEPLVRESMPSLRPSRKVLVRTLAIITATAAMTTSSKTALAATAGGIGILASNSAVKSAGAIGIIKSIFLGGGTIMGIKKALIAGVIAVAALGGGGYYVSQETSTIEAREVIIKIQLAKGKTMVESELAKQVVPIGGTSNSSGEYIFKSLVMDKNQYEDFMYSFKREPSSEMLTAPELRIKDKQTGNMAIIQTAPSIPPGAEVELGLSVDVTPQIKKGSILLQIEITHTDFVDQENGFLRGTDPETGKESVVPLVTTRSISLSETLKENEYLFVIAPGIESLSDFSPGDNTVYIINASQVNPKPEKQTDREVRRFNVGAGKSEATKIELAEYYKEVFEQMLFQGMGEEEAFAQGHRLMIPPDPAAGFIDVVSTPENLAKIEEFMRTQK